MKGGGGREDERRKAKCPAEGSQKEEENSSW